jgi:hypothetical protein
VEDNQALVLDSLETRVSGTKMATTVMQTLPPNFPTLPGGVTIAVYPEVNWANYVLGDWAGVIRANTISYQGAIFAIANAITSYNSNVKRMWCIITTHDGTPVIDPTISGRNYWSQDHKACMTSKVHTY